MSDTNDKAKPDLQYGIVASCPKCGVEERWARAFCGRCGAAMNSGDASGGSGQGGGTTEAARGQLRPDSQVSSKSYPGVVVLLQSEMELRAIGIRDKLVPIFRSSFMSRSSIAMKITRITAAASIKLTPSASDCTVQSLISTRRPTTSLKGRGSCV